MKPKYLVITIWILLVVAGLSIVGFLLLPDPSVEFHVFRDSFSSTFVDAEFHPVEVHGGIVARGSSLQEEGIPWWIRWHPRRHFSGAWQKDFVGVSAGGDLYILENDSRDKKILCYSLSIKQRTCAIVIVAHPGDEVCAERLREVIKSKYPTLPITVKLNENTEQSSGGDVLKSRTSE